MRGARHGRRGVRRGRAVNRLRAQPIELALDRRELLALAVQHVALLARHVLQAQLLQFLVRAALGRPPLPPQQPRQRLHLPLEHLGAMRGFDLGLALAAQLSLELSALALVHRRGE